MDNPNRIASTSTTQTVDRQTPHDEFGKVLQKSLGEVVKVGAQLAGPVLGPSVVTTAVAFVDGIAQKTAPSVATGSYAKSTLSAGVTMGKVMQNGASAEGSSGAAGTSGSTGTTGGTAGTSGNELLDAQAALQADGQRFNLAYLHLQDEMQKESRQFNLITNIMKVRHDSAKAAINNIR